MNEQQREQILLAMEAAWDRVDEATATVPEMCEHLLGSVLAELEKLDGPQDVVELEKSSTDPQAEHLGWLEDVLGEILELMKGRGAKYGPGNIAQFGDYGVLVRLSDKLARLQHSLELNHADESVEDIWMDIVGYGLIGLAWSRGLWPGSSKDAGAEL